MKELINKADTWDKEAFVNMFETYEGDLYRIAYLYVGKQDAALDIIQEAAYRSFKSINSLKKKQYLKTWLTKIVINCSIDYLRDQKKHKTIDVNNSLEGSENIEKFSDILDLKITLDMLIHELEHTEKTIIILKFYNDLTIKQISNLLEIPVGTIKTVLYRALKKMKNELKGGRSFE